MQLRRLAVVVALTVLAVGGHRFVVVRRALIAERAARRLSDASWTRDLGVFEDRLRQALAPAPSKTVLDEADQVLDTALSTYRPGGGH